ncbi:MAG TPA: hypothetical protein VG604_00175 [Candidatus Saccharimonadales bacterium]|nr:hypothetical protein [Candidatus Saccharimonadales bacterium]
MEENIEPADKTDQVQKTVTDIETVDQNPDFVIPTITSSGSSGLKRSYNVQAKLKKILWLVLAVGIFWSGYQLAVYQSDRSNSFSLPHFDVRPGYCDNPTFYQVDNCQSYTPPGSCRGGCVISDEPVVYLYPTRAENIHVKEDYVTGFSKTVPQYDATSGWSVRAQPNGLLKNLSDGKTYPYLVWEGQPASLKFNMTKGFVVAGSETKTFLDRQLQLVGLNQSETNTFISYWLPKMSGNPYNLIHFAGSEYTDYSDLRISPKPDSELRVYMAFKPLQNSVKAIPQSFQAFHRSGFTAVEWGGAELPANYPN